jgi:hypothetical protein
MLYSIWTFLTSSWHGLVIGFGALALAATQWKSILGLYNWCIERYDRKVFRILDDAERSVRIANVGRNILILPTHVHVIASEANRRQNRVYRSLRRLESRGLLHEAKGKHWTVGPPAISDALTSTIRFRGRFSKTA